MSHKDNFIGSSNALLAMIIFSFLGAVWRSFLLTHASYKLNKKHCQTHCHANHDYYEGSLKEMACQKV